MTEKNFFNEKKKKTAALGFLFLAVSLLSACGQEAAPAETEETFAVIEETTTAASTDAAVQAEETEAETTGEVTEDAGGNRVVEKPFEYKIVKVRDYDVNEGGIDRTDWPVYLHEEISGMLAGADFGAVNNVEGFIYGPYLNPGERSNVRFGLTETEYKTSEGEDAYAYEAKEFECFSFPELGIRSICLPVDLHADLEPLRYDNQITSVFNLDQQKFEELRGYKAPSYPVLAYGLDRSKGEKLYGDDWKEKQYLNGSASENGYVLSTEPGIFSLENKNYALEVTSRKTNLKIGADTAFAMEPKEILSELCPRGTNALWPEGVKNIRIYLKDGYAYVYLYTAMSGEGRTVSDGWLCRVKDGISQCVHLRSDLDDGTNGYKLLDYVLNYSLEFYDMDSVQYDDGDMDTYNGKLNAYQNGNGADPGTGGYWLCEGFLY